MREDARAAIVMKRYHVTMAHDEPLPPDPVIEEYKKHVDRTLLQRNLARTPQERLDAMIDMLELVEEMRRSLRR